LKPDRFLKTTLLAIAVLLTIIAVRPLVEPAATVLAQTPRFDHVFIVSTMFLYKGQQGLLVMDRRNGNVWFIPKMNDVFQDPVFVVRMQFEKLDQAPR
jgi:hypothetical protein